MFAHASRAGWPCRLHHPDSDRHRCWRPVPVPRFTRRGGVASLYDFENRKPIFPGVHASYKFCLLSLTGKARAEPAARYAFFLDEVADLDDPDRVFALSPEELALINPNTGTLPIFRNRRDAALTVGSTTSPGALDETKRDGNPWGITFKRLFHMTDDSDLFRTREQLDRDGWRLDGNVFTRDGKRMLPLYEAKMAHYFDHRWDYVSTAQATIDRQNQPRYLCREAGSSDGVLYLDTGLRRTG